MSFTVSQDVPMSLSRVTAFTVAGMAQRRPTSARFLKHHRRPNNSFKADGYAAA
jgi:hypothetical protein